MRQSSLALSIAVFVLSACGGGPSAPSEVALDRDFELRPGERAAVAGTGLVVRFIAVPEDSRCPGDAQCVWAGDATVSLGIRAQGVSEQAVDLHTALEPLEAGLGGYRIRLRLLAPLPRAEEPVPARDYVATLRVVRDG